MGYDPTIWKQLDGLIETGAARREKAGQALERSGKQFSPLDEPLRVDLGLHRWLSAAREESYSDWLAWVLGQCAPDEVNEILGIESCAPEFLCEREVAISGGRIDILLSSEDDKPFCVVEVKTRAYAQKDVDKHTTYCKRHKGCDYRFVAVLAPRACDIGRFEFQPWEAVCRGIRHAAQRRCARKENLIATAMMLAFVAAVEENLLQVSRASTRLPQYLEK